METTQEPLRGMAVIRKMLDVKKQEQKAAIHAFRTDPETKAIFEKLKKINANRRPI